MMQHVRQSLLMLACILACPAAGAQTQDRCAPLDAPLVPYDGGEAPFAVDVGQPEGWSSLSPAPGTVLDFFLGDTESGSDFLFRLSAVGPIDLTTLRESMSSADPSEISEVELENGETIVIRHPPPHISFVALVPLPGGEGRGFMVNAAVVHSANECDDRALETLGRIIRSVRPRP